MKPETWTIVGAVAAVLAVMVPIVIRLLDWYSERRRARIRVCGKASWTGVDGSLGIRIDLKLVTKVRQWIDISVSWDVPQHEEIEDPNLVPVGAADYPREIMEGDNCRWFQVPYRHPRPHSLSVTVKVTNKFHGQFIAVIEVDGETLVS